MRPPRSWWFNKRLLLIDAALLLPLIVGPQLFPALRDPSTWSHDDVREIAFSDSYHWCGYHGHRSQSGLRVHCRGYAPSFVWKLRNRHGEPGINEVLCELLNSDREVVAQRAAWLLGHWEATEAIPALVERTKTEQQAVTPDETTLGFLAWALATLGATEALPVLAKRQESAGGYRRMALASLARTLHREAFAQLGHGGPPPVSLHSPIGK